MKPIRLTMSAFGSYAGEEMIDFSGMDQGIFLITGDTGSGKTTIFDGIVYALYDRTSGGIRDGNMMRSAYAKLSSPTYVELVFSCRGEEYRVLRNPDYVRESRRKDKDGNSRLTQEKSRVELFLPDGSSFRGSKKEINGKIEEIIGLDAKQFTQVAMLAQGDFMRLLHARSEERKEIFSRIFDTGICGEIQNELRRMEKESYVALKEREQAISEQTGRILFRKDGEQDTMLEHAREKGNLKELLPILEDWIREYRKREKELFRQLEKNRKDMQKASEDGNRAEEILGLRKKIREYDRWLEENASGEQELSWQETQTRQSLEQAQAVVRECESVQEAARRSFLEREAQLAEQLKRIQGLMKLWEDAGRAEEDRKKAAEFWGQKNRAYARAQERYEQMYEAFFREQAGILARDLKEDAPCPVCGSRSHPHKAIPAEDAPDQQQVRMARQEVKRAEQEQRLAQEDCQKKTQLGHLALGSLTQEGKTMFGEAFAAEELQWRERTWEAFAQGKKNLQDCRMAETVRLQEAKIQMKQKQEALAAKTPELRDITARRDTFIRKAEQIRGQRKASAEYEERLGKGYNQKEVPSDEALALLAEEAKQMQERLKSEGNILEKSYREIYSSVRSNEKTRDVLQRYRQDYESLQEEYMRVRHLSQTAGGNLAGNVKIDFESYVQRRYFQQVIRYANQRLLQMASGQFLLRCRELDQLSGRGKGGLDLDVYSVVTDSVRDVKTLSGGESFMAALCMALGLADAISCSAGAIRLDTMFIDEGFGSLDDASREQAVRALYELAGEHRLIGIISHVTELKEQIETKLLVTRKKDGSTARWVL